MQVSLTSQISGQAAQVLHLSQQLARQSAGTVKIPATRTHAEDGQPRSKPAPLPLPLPPPLLRRL